MPPSILLLFEKRGIDIVSELDFYDVWVPSLQIICCLGNELIHVYHTYPIKHTHDWEEFKSNCEILSYAIITYLANTNPSTVVMLAFINCILGILCRGYMTYYA